MENYYKQQETYAAKAALNPAIRIDWEGNADEKENSRTEGQNHNH